MNSVRGSALGLVLTVLLALPVPSVRAAERDIVRPAKATAPFIAGLTDQAGSPVSRKRIFGKPAVVHFGFTHCPSVCPMTLNEVALLMDRLGAEADDINFVFATVDPERDTAPVLKEYIDYFDSRILGLTGSIDAIKALARHFDTTFAKRPNAHGYNVDHAIYAFLTDTAGKVVSTLYLGTDANRRLVKTRLQKLLADARR